MNVRTSEYLVDFTVPLPLSFSYSIFKSVSVDISVFVNFAIFFLISYCEKLLYLFSSLKKPPKFKFYIGNFVTFDFSSSCSCFSFNFFSSSIFFFSSSSSVSFGFTGDSEFWLLSVFSFLSDLSSLSLIELGGSSGLKFAG